MANKPKWEKPKLIVMVREDGKENVLQSCKAVFSAGEGPEDI